MASSDTYLFPSSGPVGGGWPALLRGWLPVVLLLGIFGLESSAMLGADHTSLPLQHFTHLVSGAGASAGAAIDTHWQEIHHLIRKTGHFLGYGFLSLAWLRALLLQIRPERRWMSWARMSGAGRSHRFAQADGLWRMQLAAIALTFAVAGMDELHQSFLPNRTGRFADVLLDTAGAVVLQALLRLAGCLIALIRTQHDAYPAQAEPAAA